MARGKFGHSHEFGCMITVLVLLAAIAAPTFYRRFDARRIVRASLDSVATVQEEIAAYWRERQQFPASLQDAMQFAPPDMLHVDGLQWNSSGALIIRYDSTIQDRMNIDEEPTIILRASPSDTGIRWDCSFGTVTNWFRPQRCRSTEPE